MKIFALLSLLTISSSINAEIYVSGINKEIYKGRINIQPYTESEISNLPKSCQEIKNETGTTESGEYVVLIGGKAQSIYCNMSGENVETEAPFTYAMLQDPNLEITAPLVLNSSYNNGVWNNTPLTEEDKTQYLDLINKNLTHLIRYSVKAYYNGNTSSAQNGNLIPRLNASYFNRKNIFELPDLSQLNEPPALVYARLASWNGDTDRSRLLFDQSVSPTIADSSTIIMNKRIDSGEGNWNSTPNYVRYETTIDSTAQSIRFWGSCKRYHGTQCSADVLDFTFVLFPKLPKEGEMVKIK